MITSISSATSNKISWMGFFCSWLVVSIHIVHPDNGLSSYLDKLLAGGVAKIAVPTFFCISGYLICGKLIRGVLAGIEKKILQFADTFLCLGDNKSTINNSYMCLPRLSS